MASEIKVDTISEKTSANGVVIDGALIKDSKIAATAGGGLVLLSSNTVSSSSNTAVDNIFTSAYTNYKLVMNVTGSHSGTQFITIKFRTGGTNNSSSSYTSGVRTFRINADNEFEQRTDTGTDWKLQGWDGSQSGNSVSLDATIFAPQVARRTGLTGNWMADEVTNQQGGYCSATFEGTTSFDGIDIICLGGTWTGQINIYALAE